MKRLFIPTLGLVRIIPDPKREGHYLWHNSFGWSDCSRKEDELIASILKEE